MAGREAALREMRLKEEPEESSESDEDASQWRAQLAGKAKVVGGKGPVKWILPFILVGVSSLICMWLLHIATFYYVKGILRFEAAFKPNPDYKEDASTQHFFSAGLTPDSDPIEAQLGFKDVPLKALDAVALVFPFLWFCAVLYLQDVQAWTKVLLCHSVLAVGKGIFGATTIIPDSIGWANCKKRLGPAGLAYFQNEARAKRRQRWGSTGRAAETQVPDPTQHGLWTMCMAILGVELRGPSQDRIGSGMRFCADMIYSGHTYFTILYILALCDLLRRALGDPSTRLYVETKWKRKAILVSVYLACIAQQGIEIFLVMSNRFHYTTDVVLAVLLTFLWYTSAPVCIAAKWWAQLGTKSAQEKEQPEDCGASVFGGVLQVALSGDIWLPVFCLPFCCINGHHHVISETQLRLMDAYCSRLGLQASQVRFMVDGERIAADDTAEKCALEAASKSLEAVEPHELILRAKVLSNLGQCYLATEEFSEAEKHYMEAYSLFSRTVGKRSPLFGMQAWACGNLRCAQQRFVEAIGFLGEALYVEVVKDGLSVSEMMKLVDQVLHSLDHVVRPDANLDSANLEPLRRALNELIEDGWWGTASEGGSGHTIVTFVAFHSSDLIPVRCWTSGPSTIASMDGLPSSKVLLLISDLAQRLVEELEEREDDGDWEIEEWRWSTWSHAGLMPARSRLQLTSMKELWPF
eukprot:g27586.t1